MNNQEALIASIAVIIIVLLIKVGVIYLISLVLIWAFSLTIPAYKLVIGIFFITLLIPSGK